MLEDSLQNCPVARSIGERELLGRSDDVDSGHRLDVDVHDVRSVVPRPTSDVRDRRRSWKRGDVARDESPSARRAVRQLGAEHTAVALEETTRRSRQEPESAGVPRVVDNGSAFEEEDRRTGRSSSVDASTGDAGHACACPREPATTNRTRGDVLGPAGPDLGARLDVSYSAASRGIVDRALRICDRRLRSCRLRAERPALTSASACETGWA
jgi:hypothetical protein